MIPRIISGRWLHNLHPSHRPALRVALPLLGSLGLLLALAIALPAPAWLHGQASYLPLHMLLETLAIVVAACIFAVGWATYRRLGSGNLLFLACGFLVVACLDFSHMLSYQGMPVFITPADPEKAIAFWLAARLIAALTLLWLAFAPWQQNSTHQHTWRFLLVSLLLVAVVHLLILGYPHLLPRTMIPGQGLTPFKIASEYALIALHLLAALRFWQLMRYHQPFNVSDLFSASLLMALAEFCFTLYASVTDHYNLLGHLFKVIAYGYLFRGIFLEAVEQPFSQLARSSAKLQATLDAIPDLLFELDRQHRVIGFHPSADNSLQLDPKQMLGKRIRELLPRRILSISRDTFSRAGNQGYAQSQAFRWGNQTPAIWLQMTAAVRYTDNQPDGYLVLVRNITELKQQEERITELAHFDSLTGLPNRVLFEQQSNLALKLARRQQQSMALMFIDLDHFKHINDTLGHAAGDDLLRAIALRLRSCLREEDILSRQGGDEFVIALPGINAEGAGHLGQRLLESLAQPVHFAGNETIITASIGIAVYPEDGEHLGVLMQHADAAMYKAKQQGRNDFSFFTSDIQQHMARALLLENALRSAIEQQQLSLHYQPEWSLENRQLLGFEALLRWQHPELGNISPAEFIPIAESTGQIDRIGEWVLSSGLEQLYQWRQQGFTELQLAINLSAIQFRRQDLTEQVAKALQSRDIPANRLELELTEGMAMEDPVRARTQLSALHDLGVRLAIDDFGTGFSSLAQLRYFKVDTLKIDRSFIDMLGSDQGSLEMLRSIIQLAHNLGVGTLAEGVETEHQLDVLRSLGCQRVQGFVWGHPLPARACSSYLEQMADA